MPRSAASLYGSYPQLLVSAMQDFVPQSSSPNIDYAAFHLWPDNWNTTGEYLAPVQPRQCATVVGESVDKLW
jgi:hypothetical protein